MEVPPVLLSDPPRWLWLLEGEEMGVGVGRAKVVAAAVTVDVVVVVVAVGGVASGGVVPLATMDTDRPGFLGESWRDGWSAKDPIRGALLSVMGGTVVWVGIWCDSGVKCPEDGEEVR